MVAGPKRTPGETDVTRQKNKENQGNYIGQPTIALARVTCLVDGHAEGRRVDLRPYILYGDTVSVIPGGLKRVALRKGADGEVEAVKHPQDGAGILTSLTETDGLLEFREDVTAIKPGDRVGFLSYAALMG